VNRARSWLRKLGTAGVLALGVFTFCIPFYFSALRPAERELAAQGEAAERLRSRGPFRPVSVDHRSDELRRFYGLFPPLRDLTDELEQVYTLARDSKLELMQGEYRLERPAAGLAAYRVTLPLRGSYSQIRSFVGAILRDKPTASVDGLRFERKKIAETQIEAQVRLTLYFRPSDESETR
jgi:hypothetical protein